MRKTDDGVITATADASVQSVLDHLKGSGADENNTRMILIHDSGFPVGLVDKRKLYETTDTSVSVSSVKEERLSTLYPDNSLEIALELMLKSSQSTMPVVERKTKKLLGLVTEWDILKVFEQRFIEDKHISQHISVKKNALRLMKKTGLRG
jgi:predicted transcriptional regulator